MFTIQFDVKYPTTCSKVLNHCRANKSSPSNEPGDLVQALCDAADTDPSKFFQLFSQNPLALLQTNANGQTPLQALVQSNDAHLIKHVLGSHTFLELDVENKWEQVVDSLAPMENSEQSGHILRAIYVWLKDYKQEALSADALRRALIKKGLYNEVDFIQEDCA